MTERTSAKGKRASHALTLLISYIFSIVVGAIIICAFFAKGGNFSIASNNSLLTIMGGLVLLAFLVFLWRKLRKKPEVDSRTERRIAIGLFVFIALLVGVSVCCLYTDNSTWDPKYVSIGAEKLIKGEPLPEYLSIYPFNLTLSFLAIPIVLLAKETHLGIDVSFLLAVLSGLLVFLTFLCNYLTLRMITSKNKALFVLFLASLFAPLTLYASIFYSDTVSQFLVCALLFLVIKFIKQRESFSPSKKLVYAALIGIISALAVLVKATALIFIIALIITAAIYAIRQKIDFKRAALLAAVIVLSFFLPTIGVKGMIRNYTDDSLAHPVTSWIAMGLSGLGDYNDEDAGRTTELLKKGEDANAVNVELIKTRIYDYGPFGLFAHLVKKTAAVWGCGDIGTSRALSPQPHHDTVLGEIFRDGERYNRAYLEVANIIWAGILLALLIGGIIDIKERQVFCKSLAKTVIIGLFLFLEFWETQSRYLYIFLPIIFALAVFMVFRIAESDAIRTAALTIRGIIKYKKNDSQYRNINILDASNTLAQIKKGKTIIRLGDGEMAVILGHSIWFQKQSDQLKNDLENVLKKADSKNILVCVPRTIIDMSGYRMKARRFWYRELIGTRHEWRKRLLDDKIYGETSVTRARTDLSKKNQDEVFEGWKNIFNNRDIVLIEGNVTRTGVKNDLFSGAKTVRRIIGPSKNAYDKVPEIIKKFESLKIKKTALVLVSLGPAAKKIALELHDKGYQVIDMGHLGQEYAFYVNNEHRKAEDDDRFDRLTDEKYEKSIIARIEK